jgi:hypothetical protein
MSSDFFRVFADASPVLDSTFAERLLIMPRKDGPYTVAGPDPDRPEFEANGVIDERSIPSRNSGKGRFDSNQPDLMTGVFTIDFSEDVFSGPSQWPKSGDRIRALERPTFPEYEVVYAAPSAYGRVEFHVTKATR